MNANSLAHLRECVLCVSTPVSRVFFSPITFRGCTQQHATRTPKVIFLHTHTQAATDTKTHRCKLPFNWQYSQLRKQRGRCSAPTLHCGCERIIIMLFLYSTSHTHMHIHRRNVIMQGSASTFWHINILTYKHMDASQNCVKAVSAFVWYFNPQFRRTRRMSARNPTYQIHIHCASSN